MARQGAYIFSVTFLEFLSIKFNNYRQCEALDLASIKAKLQEIVSERRSVVRKKEQKAVKVKKRKIVTKPDMDAKYLLKLYDQYYGTSTSKTPNGTNSRKHQQEQPAEAIKKAATTIFGNTSERAAKTAYNEEKALLNTDRVDAAYFSAETTNKDNRVSKKAEIPSSRQEGRVRDKPSNKVQKTIESDEQNAAPLAVSHSAHFKPDLTAHDFHSEATNKVMATTLCNSNVDPIKERDGEGTAKNLERWRCNKKKKHMRTGSFKNLKERARHSMDVESEIVLLLREYWLILQ